MTVHLSSPRSWSAPPPGFLKLNVDSSFPTGSSLFAVGIVARDFSGRCVRWSRREFRGRPPPVVGEATAVLV